MGLILVVVIVAAVIYFVMSWRKRRRAAGKPATTATVTPPDVPKFRVVALGLQGSGKTLLLMSMYRRLYTPGDRGYYMRVPDDQLIELNQWYRQVADSGEDWPSGTTRQEMREFEFSVMAHIAGDALPVVRIGYLEYPGELLTDRDLAGSTAQADLRTAVGEAHALIGIIDGLRLLQTHRQENHGSVILQANLDAMIHSMLEASAPIAFVITKWDLLDELDPDENTRLHMVRELLMNVDGFRDLVWHHSRRRVIRLIPVTAVGHDFAVFDGKEVRKKPNGRFLPRNVDLPLSAVIPDVLQQVDMSLDQATRAAVVAEAQRRLRMGPAEALRSLSVFVAQLAGRTALSFAGAGWLVDGMSLLMDSYPATGNTDQRRAALSEADEWAEEFVRTRRRVIQQLQSQVGMLEARLPASRMSGEY
jgi:hypothetical protein